MSTRKSQNKKQNKNSQQNKKGWRSHPAFFFCLGIIVSIGLFNTWQFINFSQAKNESNISGNVMRSVYELLALSDEELEKVDILEMNMAVAKEISGLEKLDHKKYKKNLDKWTNDFQKWYPTVEHAYFTKPDYYKSDINLFKIGMLAQFLDNEIGVKYNDEQKAAIKNGVKEIRYTDPADLFLFGLIDRKEGTCGSMPTLHVAIGRRLGWPVSLACVKSHYVCRYDDGKVAYNIEATDTGRGGFAMSMDDELLARGDTTKHAVKSGSDLNKLSAREMLGIFIGLRARHYDDTNQHELAEHDCLLARSLIPQYRRLYHLSVMSFLRRGETIFMRNEKGHPVSIANYISGGRRVNHRTAQKITPPTHHVGPVQHPQLGLSGTNNSFNPSNNLNNP